MLNMTNSEGKKAYSNLFLSVSKSQFFEPIRILIFPVQRIRSEKSLVKIILTFYYLIKLFYVISKISEIIDLQPRIFSLKY